MFTWICPQCGREVPPAYNACPNCSGEQAGQAPPPPGQTAPVGTAPPSPRPPQAAPYGQTPTYAQPPQYAQPAANLPAAPGFMQQPPARGVTLPPWLMGILSALLFLAVGAALFFGIKHFNGSSEASASTSSPQDAKASQAALKKANTLQKYVEVVGMRLTENSGKKPEVRFLIVNHSGAEIADLGASVNLWARTAKSDEEAVGTFTFKVASLGAYESKDLTAPLNTKLKVYELPDWQNLTAELQITSPQ